MNGIMKDNILDMCRTKLVLGFLILISAIIKGYMGEDRVQLIEITEFSCPFLNGNKCGWEATTPASVTVEWTDGSHNPEIRRDDGNTFLMFSSDDTGVVKLTSCEVPIEDHEEIAVVFDYWKTKNVKLKLKYNDMPYNGWDMELEAQALGMVFPIKQWSTINTTAFDVNMVAFLSHIYTEQNYLKVTFEISLEKLDVFVMSGLRMFWQKTVTVTTTTTEPSTTSDPTTTTTATTTTEQTTTTTPNSPTTTEVTTTTFGTTTSLHRTTDPSTTGYSDLNTNEGSTADTLTNSSMSLTTTDLTTGNLLSTTSESQKSSSTKDKSESEPDSRTINFTTNPFSDSDYTQGGRDPTTSTLTRNDGDNSKLDLEKLIMAIWGALATLALLLFVVITCYLKRIYSRRRYTSRASSTSKDLPKMSGEDWRRSRRYD